MSISETKSCGDNINKTDKLSASTGTILYDSHIHNF
jgi:hypothetical protein